MEKAPEVPEFKFVGLEKKVEKKVKYSFVSQPDSGSDDFSLLLSDPAKDESLSDENEFFTLKKIKREQVAENHFKDFFANKEHVKLVQI